MHGWKWDPFPWPLLRSGWRNQARLSQLTTQESALNGSLGGRLPKPSFGLSSHSPSPGSQRSPPSSQQETPLTWLGKRFHAAEMQPSRVRCRSLVGPKRLLLSTGSLRLSRGGAGRGEELRCSITAGRGCPLLPAPSQTLKGAACTWKESGGWQSGWPGGEEARDWVLQSHTASCGERERSQEEPGGTDRPPGTGWPASQGIWTHALGPVPRSCSPL